MARYPKPKGWDGGPDGYIVRQGSGGRLSWNQNITDSDEAVKYDRHNCLDFDDSEFGGVHYEYGDA